MTTEGDKHGPQDVMSLVVATGHDFVTGTLLEAAKKAQAILQDAGHEVLTCYGPNATCSSLFMALFEHKQKGKRFALASISAHGSNKGLLEPGGGLLFDPTGCELLADSILLLQACLEKGHFPETCIQGKRAARACIGFHPKLAVPRPRWWAKLLGRATAKRARSDFLECIVTPVRALIRGAHTERATRDGAKAWGKAATAFVRKDKRIAAVFEVNARCLDIWGSRTATL